MHELVKLIDNADEFPFELVLNAVNDVETGGFSEQRKIAEEFLQGAGKFLPAVFLRPFIMAEITDDEAVSVMNKRKKMIEDACYLLPTMLRLTKARTANATRYVLQHVVDCCHDFPIIAKAVHRKRGHREAVQNLNSMISNLEELIGLLDQNKSFVDFDFENQIRFDTGKKVSVHEFIREAQHMRLAAQHVVFSDEIGEHELNVTDNRAKTLVVDYTYRIALWLKCPLFVTTPGSDFSLFCSLLYELASGEADASFQGAISKYARSAERKQNDEWHQETIWEISEVGMRTIESDNFASLRHTEEIFHKEIVHLEKLRSWIGEDDFASEFIDKRVLDTHKEHERAQRRHGPFLVWANQISQEEQVNSLEEMSKIRQNSLNLEKKVGELQRRLSKGHKEVDKLERDLSKTRKT